MKNDRYELDEYGLINNMSDLRDAVHKLVATIAHLLMVPAVERAIGSDGVNLFGGLCVAMHDMVCPNRTTTHVLEDSPEKGDTWTLPTTPPPDSL